MKKLNKAWIFIKKNWKWITATLGIISLILCLYWGIEDKLLLAITKKKIELSKNQKEIDKLEAKLEVLQLSEDSVQEEIDSITDRIDSIKKDISKRKAEINKLTLQQKADRFKDLGY